MAEDFKIQLTTDLDTSAAEGQLNDLTKERKIKIDLELGGKNEAKQFAASLQAALKSVDTKSLAKDLYSGFSVSNTQTMKSIKADVQQIVNAMSTALQQETGKIDLSKMASTASHSFNDAFGNLAETLRQSAGQIKSQMADVYGDFYNAYGNQLVHVSESVKQSLGELYSEISNSGRITRDALKGFDLEANWEDIHSQFGFIIDDVARLEGFNLDNKADQIMAFIKALDTAKQKMTETLSYDQLSKDMQSQIDTSVRDELNAMFTNIQSQLESAFAQNMAQMENTLFVDVRVDKSQLSNDIKAALTDASAQKLPLTLELNETDITSKIQSAVQAASVGGTTIDIILDVESIKAKLAAELQNLGQLPVDFKIDTQKLQNDIKTAVESIQGLKVPVKVEVVNQQSPQKGQAQNVNVTGQQNVQSLVNQVRNLSTAGTQAQGVFQSLGMTFKQAFGMYTFAHLMQRAIMEVVQAGKQAVDTIKEINTAMKSIQMVTGATDTEITKLQSSYNSLGRQLGAVTTEITTAADAWLHTGASIEEVNKLVEATMIFAKTAGISSEDAQSYLVSASRGYEIQADNLVSIIDKLETVDKNAAVSASQLAEAMAKTASSANQSGTSIDSLIAQIATLSDVTQQQASTIGNFEKTLYSRLYKVKAGVLKYIDTETMEEVDISQLETALKKAGVSLRSDANEFRDATSILSDLAAQWDSLSDALRNSIGTELGGTRGKNFVDAMLSNWDKVQQLTEISETSEGAALERFNVYLSSIQSKTDALQASLEGLALDLIPQDVYAKILDFAKAMADAAEETDILKNAIAGLGVAGGMVVFSKVSGWIQSAVQEFNNLSTAMNMVRSVNVGSVIDPAGYQQLLSLTSGLSQSQLQLIVSSNALDMAQKTQIITNSGLSQAQKEAMLSTLQMSSAQGTATTTTTSLSGALSGLWQTLMANPMVLVAAGVTAALTAFSAYKRSQEEALQSAKDGAGTFDKDVKSLEQQAERVKELREQLDSGTLTESEAYTVKSELLDIQNQLNESYGNMSQAIDLVNGKLDTQIGKMQELSKAQADAYLNENRDAIRKAEKAMTEEVNGYIGTFYGVGADADAVKDLLASYGDIFDLREDGPEFTIYVTGDVSQAHESVQTLMTDLRGLEKEYSDSYLLDDILTGAGTQLGILDETIEKYGDIYEAAQKAKLISDPTQYEFLGGKSTAAEILKDLESAVNDYNKALKNTDDTAISKAQEQFETVKQGVQDLLDAGLFGDYSRQVQEIISYLNEAAIAERAFISAAENSGGSPVEQRIYKLVTELKDMNLTDVDIMGMFSTSGLQDGENHIRALVAASKSLGVQCGASTQEIQPLIDLLIQLGVVTGNITEEVTDGEEVIQEYTGAMEDYYAVLKSGEEGNFQDTINDYISDLEKLKGAIEDFNKGELSEADQLQLKLEFPELAEYEDFGEGLRSVMDGIIHGYDRGAEEILSGIAEAAEEVGVSSEGAGSLVVYLDSQIDALGADTEAGQAMKLLKEQILGLYEVLSQDDPVNSMKETITNAIELKDTLDEVWSTSIDSGGMVTIEQMDAVNEAFAELEGYDPSKVFKATEKGIKLNEKAFKEYTELLQNMQVEQIDTLIADKQKEMGQAIVAYSDFDTSGIEAQINALKLLKSAYTGVITEASESEKIFSELLSGDQVSGLVDNIQSDITKLQEALQSLDEGTEIDLTDLLQQFPELIGHTDNLVESIENLQTDKIAEFKAQWQDAMSGLTDPVQIATAESFFQTVMYGLDTIMNPLQDLNKMLEDNISTQDNINAALASNVKGTGISVQQVRNLTNAYRNLNGFDASKLYTRTASGIRINTDELRKLNAQLKDKTMGDYYTLLGQKMRELAQARLSGADASVISRLEQEIELIRNMTSQYEGLTSAYQRWLDAQSNGEQGDIYDSFQTAIERGDELLKSGLVGTNEFRAIADLFSYEDLSTAGIDQLVASYKAASPVIKDFFTEGYEGAQKFVDYLADNNFAETWTDNNGEEFIRFLNNVDEVAQALGIDVEAVEAIYAKLGDYGFDVSFLNTGLDQFYADINGIQEKADEARETLQGMGDISVDLDFDLNTANLSELESQLSSLEEQRQIMIDSGASQEQINAIDILIQECLGYIGALNDANAEPSVSMGQLTQAYELLSEAQYLMDIIDGTTVDPEISTEEAQTQLSQVSEKIAGLDTDVQVTVGVTQQGEVPTKESILQKIGSIEIPWFFKKTGGDTPNADTSDSSSTTTITVEGLEDLQQAKTLISEIPTDTPVKLTISAEGDTVIVELNHDVDELNNKATNPVEITVVGDAAQAVISEISSAMEQDLPSGTPHEFTLKANDNATVTITAVGESLDGMPEEKSVTLTGDNEPFLTAIAEVINQGEEFEGQNYNATLGANDDTAAGIQSAESNLAAYEEKSAEADLNGNTDGLDNAITNAEQSLQDFNDTTASGTITTTDEASAVALQAKESLSGIEGEYPASLTVDNSTIEPTISEAQATIDSLTGKEVSVTANTGSSKEDVEELTGAIADLYGKTVIAKANVFGTSEVWNLITAIDNLKSKSVTVTSNQVTNVITNYQTSGSPSSSHGGTNGKFATGTMLKPAYSNGRVGIDHDQIALTSEEGQESIIRDGIWRLLAPYPHMEQLRKDDIVFSAEQTSDLIKHGKTAAYGRRAYADGTLGKAYATGVSGSGRRKVGYYASSGGSTSSSNSRSTGATYSNTSAVEENTAAVEESTEAAEEFNETLDLVERKSNRLAQAVQNVADQITDYVSAVFKKIKLNQQDKAIERQINGYGRSYETYMGRANSVDLSEDWKSRVREGDYSIVDITDEDLKKNIDAYAEWIDKAEEASNSIHQLRNQQLQLYDDLIHIPIESAEKKLDRLSESYNNLGSYAEMSGSSINNLYKLIAENAGSVNQDTSGLFDSLTSKQDELGNMKDQPVFKITQKIKDKQIKNLRNQETINLQTVYKVSNEKSISDKELQQSVTTLQALGYAVNELNGEMIDTNGLSGELQKAAESYNMSLQKNMIVTNALDDATNNLIDSQIQLANARTDYAKSTMDSVSDYYGSQQGYYKARQSTENTLQERKELTGKSVERKDYHGSIYVLSKDIELAEKKLYDLQTAFNSAMSEGHLTEYTQEWWEAKTQIEQAKNEVYSLQNAQIKLNQQMAQVPLDNIQKYIDKLAIARNRLDALIKLRAAQGKYTDPARIQAEIQNYKDSAAKEWEAEKVAHNYANQASLSSDGMYRGKTAEQWTMERQQHENAALSYEADVEELRKTLNELPFEQLADRAKVLSADLEVVESEFDLKEAIGQSLTAIDLRKKEAVIVKQLGEQTKQSSNYYKLWQQALAEGRLKEAAEYEAAYKQSEAAANGYKTALVDVNDAMTNLPVDNLKKCLDILTSWTNYYEGILDLNEAGGKYNTKDDIQNVINSEKEQLDTQNDLNALYKKNMDDEIAKGNVEKADEWQQKWIDGLTAANKYQETIFANQKRLAEFELEEIERKQEQQDREMNRIKSAQQRKEDEGYYLEEKDYLEELLLLQEQISTEKAKIDELQALRDKAIAEDRLKDADEYQARIDEEDAKMNGYMGTLQQLRDKIEDLGVTAADVLLDLLDGIISYAQSTGDTATEGKANTQAAEVSQNAADDRKNARQNAVDSGRNKRADEVYKQELSYSTRSVNYANAMRGSSSSEKETVLEKLQRELDALDAYADVIRAKMDFAEAQSKDVAKDLYQAEIDSLEERIAKNREIAEEAMKQYNSKMSKGNAKEAAEFLRDAKNAEAEMYNLRAEIEQVGDEMRKVWITRPIDLYIDKLEQLRSSLETLSGIINDEMLYDDHGGLTDFGITQMALNLKEYESDTESLRVLLQKRQAYIDEYASGANEYYSRVELEEDLKEVTGEIQDMLSKAASARQKIVEMITQTGKQELDALKKVIGKRKELIQQTKNFYSWDRTLKDKTNDIALLEKQQRALENLTDSESRMRLQKINQQLADSRQDLDDMIRDHSIELQIQGLDDLQNSLDEAFERYTHELNSNLESITGAVSDATNKVVSAVGTVESTIGMLLGSFNVAGLNAETAGYTRQYGVLPEVATATDNVITLDNGSVLMPVNTSPMVSTASTANSGIGAAITKGSEFMDILKQHGYVYNNVPFRVPIKDVPAALQSQTVNIGGISNSYVIENPTDADAVIQAIKDKSLEVAKVVTGEVTKNINLIATKKSWY